MTDKSRPNHLLGLSPDLTTRGLSAQQRKLIELMSECRFGRIENVRVRNGQPILDKDVRVIRVARLGAHADSTDSVATEEFELKRTLRDLFDELERLRDGTVVTLEFRHGLPRRLETTNSSTPT